MAQSNGAPPTQRFSVTLTEFTVFELDGLVGLLGPTRAQVVARVVEDWLLNNVGKIEHLRERHTVFQELRAARRASRGKGRRAQ